MKWLSSFCLTLLTLFCSSMKAEDCNCHASKLAHKIYVDSKNLDLSPEGIILILGNDPIPINSISHDEHGYYITHHCSNGATLEDDGAIDLCPACGFKNDPPQAYCSRCGFPIWN